MQGRLDAERSPAGRELLSLSVVECKRTVVESLRQHAWHAAWLLAGWKQEAALALAAATCRLLAAAAARPGPPLRFLPELYLEAALDMMHSGRRAEGRVWSTPGALCAGGLDCVVGGVAAALGDARILSPEAGSMLMQTAWVVLEEAVSGGSAGIWGGHGGRRGGAVLFSGGRAAAGGGRRAAGAGRRRVPLSAEKSRGVAPGLPPHPHS
jgi:hypothetical protein